jgi:uridine phosphorylase
VRAANTIHLHPTAGLAEWVLLPGDPGRALLLAQLLLSEPKMFNHNRGLWGYTGTTAGGFELTIQSTGMGGPSAAIVVAELAELGARRLIRVGTCGGLSRSLGLGDLVVVSEAIAADGTSRALGATERERPDRQLLAALRRIGGEHVRAGAVASTDLFYDVPAGEERRWAAAGALVVDMETATLFALGRRRGLRTASLLLVSDLLLPRRVRIEPQRLRAAEERLGRLAAAAIEARLERAAPPA